MIFGVQKNLKAWQKILLPVTVPLLCLALVPVAVVSVLGFARDRIRNGFWG